ncbi:ATP-binding protein [Chitinophaga arvensicola]|uniref:histidine kinase n=1 Tax=Chitinophaga arvensicola TaxID=29529 RepID=A0A1I0QR77_9BACT|nr:ATP-binding protein [Chitinophaga arvensicola]SEW30010.1 Histidine kinase-, DNA gyrase B-, and HSP90-like ATPase [Chitinophaga arvensicola]
MSCLRGAGLWFLLLISQALCAQHNEIATIKNALPQITDSATYTDALNRLALLYLARQLDSSGDYARKANDLATRIHYDKGQRNALLGMGRYYALRPHRYLSYLFYDNALTASRAAGDSAGAATALMNIGTYFQYQQNHTAAQSYLNKALKAAWDAGLDSLRAWVLVSFYTVNESDSAMLPTAQKALQQAATIIERYHDVSGSLYTKLFLAHEKLREGNVKKAEEELKSVISAADSLGLNYLSMYASMQLTGYRIWQKQPDSLLYQQQAVHYAVAGGYAGLLLPLINDLYHQYQQTGDSMQAASYSRLALGVLQQQQEDMQAGEADYLSYAFGDEWLDSLRKQNYTRKAQLAFNRSANSFWYYQLGIITAIVVLLIILLIYFIRAYRLSKKNTASMALLQEEIRIGNSALQDSDDFKNKLISMIAHDFRTPLYNIVNITGFIDDKALTVADAASMILEVEQTAAATLSIFDEILRWIRTQLSGFIYRPKILLLEEMIDTTVNSLQHLLTAKEIQLRIDIPAGTSIIADYEMLQFIHRNFLHNAIKFSPDYGIITVKATRSDRWITVSFTDEGAGIDVSVLPHLFQWNNGTYEQERAGKGAGLALIICKDFMDKMSGRIKAENNTEEGSTFYYQLPESLKTV